MNRKHIAVVAAAGILALGLSSLADADRRTATTTAKTALTIKNYIGPKQSVPANGKFYKAFARCPRGYYATGGGLYSGAIVEVAQGPTPDRRGWFIDGTNNDPRHRTFVHRAVVVCAKGALAVQASGPAAQEQTAVAEREYRQSHPRDGG